MNNDAGAEVPEPQAHISLDLPMIGTIFVGSTVPQHWMAEQLELFNDFKDVGILRRDMLLWQP